MKTLTIYERTILERTGFQKYLYKEVTQATIFYDDKQYFNHAERIDNPRLRVKFAIVLKTRSKAEIQKFMDKLGRTDTDKWIKNTLSEILEGK